MNVQGVLDSGQAPTSTALHERLVGRRSKIHQPCTDDSQQLGEELDASRRPRRFEAGVNTVGAYPRCGTRRD